MHLEEKSDSEIFRSKELEEKLKAFEVWDGDNVVVLLTLLWIINVFFPSYFSRSYFTQCIIKLKCVCLQVWHDAKHIFKTFASALHASLHFCLKDSVWSLLFFLLHFVCFLSIVFSHLSILESMHDLPKSLQEFSEAMDGRVKVAWPMAFDKMHHTGEHM